MSNKSKYTITSYSRSAYDQCEGELNRITGYDSEVGRDTLTEAKAQAKHMISEAERIANEASERAVYAKICTADGVFVWDILDLHATTVGEASRATKSTSSVPTPPVSSPTPRAFTAALKKVLAAHGISDAEIKTKTQSFAGLGYGEGATASVFWFDPATMRPTDALLADLEATRLAFCATAGGPAFDPAKKGKRSSFLVGITVAREVKEGGGAYVTSPKDEIFCRTTAKDKADFLAGKITPELLLRPSNGKGYLIVHWAASNGHLLQVPVPMLSRELLFLRTSDGSTPLHEAARMGHLHEIPRLADLLVTGDLSVEDGNRYTPLEFAFKQATNSMRHAANLPQSFVRRELAHIKDAALTARYDELLGQLWMVESNYVGNWGDAEWTVDSEPHRFVSRAEAEAAIRKCVKDANEEGMGYSASEYRAVRVTEQAQEDTNDAPLPDVRDGGPVR